MRNAILRKAYRAGYIVMPLLWRFTRPQVRGAMVAIRHADRILFVRNSYRPEWTLPGGGIEPEEQPRETALREMREEIGWTVAPADLIEIGDVAVVLRHRHDHVTLFLYRADRLQPVSIDEVEVVEHRFLTRQEAKARLIQPHLACFLDRIYG